MANINVRFPNAKYLLAGLAVLGGIYFFSKRGLGNLGGPPVEVGENEGTNKFYRRGFPIREG